MQRPPIFSALKVDGERAYDLARAGETVELAHPRLAAAVIVVLWIASFVLGIWLARSLV